MEDNGNKEILKPGTIELGSAKTIPANPSTWIQSTTPSAQNSSSESNDTLKNRTYENTNRDKRKSEDGKQNTSKKQKGTNKNRGPTFRLDRETQLCPKLVDRREESDPLCSMHGCKFVHDVENYMVQKLPALGEECYVYNIRGHCPRGLTCRFGSKHITKTGLNLVNEDLHKQWISDKKLHTTNNLSSEVQLQLRKRTYNFEKAKKSLAQIGLPNANLKDACEETVRSLQHEDGVENEGLNDPQNKMTVVVSSNREDTLGKDCLPEVDLDVNTYGPIIEHDSARLKRNTAKVDWRDKLYLSPLTTVGNLPFRRVCKEFGADITCGEMALAVNLLQGKPQEWALTKRHGSEDIFGVQLCGNNPQVMTKCAQLIQDQVDIDFVDINVGCPIDLIYRQGAGSGLLNKKKVLFSIVRSMKSVLDVPLTVKTRTGVYTGKNVAHTYMKDLTAAGADLITIHGRTKEQRYTKLADWEYIEQCAKLAFPTPLIGNGDILSYEDYDSAKKQSPTCASVMIGRGALIKPWLFTEIKEHRHWDISSQERYEMLQRYTNYGLEHWGSDTKGVESTRRFLLEWLSFLYRYVPVGLMEVLPQKMNERPPKFVGRNNLEILLASSNCTDWIKISEMLLGPVPDGFHFLPKHKANSWT